MRQQVCLPGSRQDSHEQGEMPCLPFPMRTMWTQEAHCSQRRLISCIVGHNYNSRCCYLLQRDDLSSLLQTVTFFPWEQWCFCKDSKWIPCQQLPSVHEFEGGWLVLNSTQNHYFLLHLPKVSIWGKCFYSAFAYFQFPHKDTLVLASTCTSFTS